jgi:signal transduction histidine kinase
MILKRHNASIDVESKINAGTKFTIKLPVEENTNSLDGRVAENTPVK